MLKSSEAVTTSVTFAGLLTEKRPPQIQATRPPRLSPWKRPIPGANSPDGQQESTLS